MKHKLVKIIEFIIWIILYIIVIWIIQHSVADLKELRSLNFDDLTFEEVTFVKYDTIPSTKVSDNYEIYVEEYELPFYISDTTQKKLDKKMIENLGYNEKIIIKYKDSSNEDYQFEICEFSYEDEYLLTYDDYYSINNLYCWLSIILFVIILIMCIISTRIPLIKYIKQNTIIRGY